MDEHELESSIASRLRKLHTLPIDTTRLDQQLRKAIPQPITQRRFRFRPLRAVAALVLLTGITAGIVIGTSGGPAQASTAQMVQVYHDMVANRIPVHQADSIDQASAILAQNEPDAPNLPQAPESHVMSCCMKNIKNRKVACVLLKNEGEPITMSVAKSSDMKMTCKNRTTHDGKQYSVETVGPGLTMVMTERNNRWVCLIGKVPAERLIEIAGKLQF
jgi:hypothetical protein